MPIAVLLTIAGLLPLSLFPSSASGSPAAPTITSFSPPQGPVGTTVTISGTNLGGETSVTFGATAATVLVDKTTKLKVLVPSEATTSSITVTTPGGSATTSSDFVVTTPLSGVASLVSGIDSSCAVLASGGVDCWGYGAFGELGDGVFEDSAAAVAVVGVGGSSTLGGVASLMSVDFPGDQNGYCALLTSGGVDCWGIDDYGQLGDGIAGPTTYSAVPEAVVGVGDSGTLGGVVSLASDGNTNCALLASGAVDCWGQGTGLGNGTDDSSAVPVAVAGVGDSGTLGGVVSLASSTGLSGSFCAVLTSGGVDCWGLGQYGQLGDGLFDAYSLVPVEVVGVGGTGTLGGVASLTSDSGGGEGGTGSYCALSIRGEVDCWGYGYNGQLGDGVFYTSHLYGSALPVAVLGVGGSGTLSGVVSLAGDALNNNSSYCALLTSGEVDCWGYGHEGELGDGIHYKTGNQGSAVPVAVLGVGGSDALGGVMSLVGDAQGFCSLLTFGGVDCWGAGYRGQLGDGVFQGSAVPVAVLGVGGAGSLTGVASLASGQIGNCSVLTSGGVDCWGKGNTGQLGDGLFYATPKFGSAIPVAVVTPVPADMVAATTS